MSKCVIAPFFHPLVRQERKAHGVGLNKKKRKPPTNRRLSLWNKAELRTDLSLLAVVDELNALALVLEGVALRILDVVVAAVLAVILGRRDAEGLEIVGDAVAV
jgi:hypothetical protein